METIEFFPIGNGAAIDLRDDALGRAQAVCAQGDEAGHLFLVRQ
jgi:hypothetical protein